jgi:DnaJ family protein C protein 27
MSSRGRAAAEAANASRRDERRSADKNAMNYPSSSSSNSSSVGEIPKKKSQMLRIKVLSMGDAAAGKSCLIKRYCEERFVSKYISTIGIDYGVKPTRLNGFDLRVNFWDMSGSDAFFEVRNEFYKESSGAILVYDVSNRASFDSLPSWLAEARKFGAPSAMPIVLVGNKCDKRRVVQESEGIAFAEENQLVGHYDGSASSGANVLDLFENLFKAIIQN